MPVHLRTVRIEDAAVVPSILGDISVPAGVSVVSTIGIAIVSVGSVGAGAWTSPRTAGPALKLALASAGEFVCMSLAGFNDLLELLNQIVVFVNGLQVSQQIFGGVAEKTDVVGSLSVALSHLQDVVVIFGLLVCLDEPVKVGRLWVVRALGRVASLNAGKITVGRFGLFLFGDLGIDNRDF